ncbi:MAG: TonB-dependent siderophore receptor [Steroidobacteraceae bacterium]
MPQILRSSVAFAVATSLLSLSTRAAEPAEASLETVNVTGERLRDTSDVGSRLSLTLQETPAALAVIPREDLDLRGDVLASIAVARAPGFAPVGMSAFAGSALAARGFSGNNSVAQLYDGNRLLVSGGAMSFPTDTWSFERIEVLAGPASVLYGAGSIGGAVNYVPRQIRRDTFRNEAYVSYGSWDSRRVAVASTGPLGDRIGYRANVVFNDTDGYVDRNGHQNTAVSLALESDIGSAAKLTLMYDRGDIQEDPYYGAPLINGVVDRRTRRLNYNVTDAYSRFLNDWARARLDWTVSDAVTLRNEVYWLDTSRDFRNLENYTWNRTTGLIDRSFNFGTDIDQTQKGDRLDATFKSTVGGRENQLVVGAEFNHVDYHTDNVTTTNTSVNPYSFNPGLFNDGAGLVPTLTTNTDHYGVFAEDAFDLTPRWKLVGGVRYEKIELERTDDVARRTVELDFKPLTWRLGSVFELTPETSLYAQYVVGNDAAGSLVSLPAANAARLQTGRQAEIGVKQGFLGGKASWTLAAYRITKNNLVSRDPLNPNVAQQIGEQSSKGLEGSLTIEPIAGLLIDANFALLEAQFEDFNELIGTTLTRQDGHVPPNTPERLANLYASYRLGGGFEVGGGARYVGERFSDNSNTLRIPSYLTADAFVNWRWRESTVTTLRVRNLNDEQWVVAPYNAGRQWALGDPRSYEISVRHVF